jgi:hypothetical protein
MKESDIRPEALLKRYLELCEQDAKLCFAETPRREIPCVACESENLVREFEKNGFAYSSCQNCGTLSQSPRPSIEAFEAFYQNSVSSRYWAENFSRLWQKRDEIKSFVHALIVYAIYVVPRQSWWSS